MSKNLMTSIKISKEINTQMLHDIISANYGMRGKSKWIIEAINDFLELDSYPEYVDIASEMADLSIVISIRLPEELHKLLDFAVIKVREKFPSMEGVKSNIIRASILQKLIRKNT